MILLLNRQLIPLLLLYSNNTPVNGRTRMQKLVFLIEKKLDINEYNFIPYDYGPFSKELYKDIDELINDDYIEEIHEQFEDNIVFTYRLTLKGKKLIKKLLQSPNNIKKINIINIVKSNYCYLTLDELIGKVYAEYPKYAENSIYKA